MDAQLVLIEGGKTVVVRPKLPTVIGRNTEADVQVPDSMVSRRHCELYVYDGQLAVRDLGSVNGTLVNSHKIEQDTFLSTGDTLTIGKVTFRVEVEAADPESFPPGEAPAGAPVAAPEQSSSDSGVVTIESEAADSTVHSESAVLNYQAGEEGSFIGISAPDEDDALPEADDEDDDGLGDFLKGLGG